MIINDRIAELRRSAAAIAALLDGVSAEQAHWRPENGGWTLVEVINHLADEEHEDFRLRLELTLSDPGAEWPPIDPERDVVARDYNAREIGASIESFVEQRRRSLEWLESLASGDADLDRAHEHPVLEPLRAGDLLAAWSAHDLLHLRQIVRLQLEYLREHARPYSTRYAGD